MIGFFYDDLTHIIGSCQRIEAGFTNRYLIYLYHCYFADSPNLVRISSLILIATSLYFLSKIMKQLEVKIPTLAYFCVFLHPVILFPFFYSSQISTAVSFAWTTAVSYLSFKKKVNWALCTPLIFLGLGLRYETSFYYIMFQLSVFGILFANRSVPILDILKSREFKNSAIFAFALFILSQTLGALFPSFHTVADVTNVYKSKLSYFPPESHYFVQFKALAMYFTNLFLPQNASFYYPWTEWIRIHEDKNYQIFLSLFAAAALFIPLVAVFILRNSNKKRLKTFFMCISIFSAACLTLSFRIRQDWYFQSRQFFGSFFLLIGFFYLISNLKKVKVLIYGLGIFFGLCTFTHITSHYSSEQYFYAWEIDQNKGQHPSNLAVAGKDLNLEAYKVFAMNALKLIPEWTLNQSQAARRQFITSISHLYLAALYSGDSRIEKFAYQKMPLIYGTLPVYACLASDFEPVENCKKLPQSEKLCRDYSKNKMHSWDFSKTRISMKNFCSSL